MAKEHFCELDDYFVDSFKAALKNLNIPVDVKFVYQKNDKQKTMVKIKKVARTYTVMLKADLIVSFNGNYFYAFDDETKNILIEQELALIEFNMDSATLKLVKPDLMTSSALVEKYGLNAVKRAIQINKSYSD
jgi:hypothetical protein